MATNSSYLIDFLYPKALVFGNKVCHQLDERSFHIGIRKLPLCARCTGIYIGFVLSLISIWFYTLPLPLSILFIIAMVLDGYIQLVTHYTSTNFRRLLTGLLFGWSLLSLVVGFVNQIW